MTDAPTPRAEPVAMAWSDGDPPKWFGEWFIALLDNSDRVVLRRLPEEFTYDYRTADETYYMARRLKRWMQFPDSQYVPLASPPTDDHVRALVEAASVALYALEAGEGPNERHRVAHELRRCLAPFAEGR